MAGKTITQENAVLDEWFGAQAVSVPATWYVALFTVAPSDSGGGTEVTGGSYARVAVTNNLTNFPAASGGSKSNGTAITFPTATAGWGTCVAFALFTASSGGSPLYWNTLTSSLAVTTGMQPSFTPGSLVCSED